MRKVRCEMCSRDLSPIRWEDGVVTENPALYEFRGRSGCENCLDKLVEKVELERAMEIYR